MRSEEEIFADLSLLCTSPGFIHALAYLTCSNNFIFFDETLTSEAILPQYSKERLIRTEISTLVGLLVKKPIDFDVPSEAQIEAYVERAFGLLAELHAALTVPLTAFATEPTNSYFRNGQVLREAMFYGGEAAYLHQYRDLALKRYDHDNDWLIENKGFSMGDAIVVAKAIARLQEQKILTALRNYRNSSPQDRTLLPGFILTPAEVTAEAGCSPEITNRVLATFSLREGESNGQFKSISDFNATNACPLIPYPDRGLILFHLYTLGEALYDSPLFWMREDKAYIATALKHRGDFTEAFCRERLERVFGKSHVHSNVKLLDDRRNTLGEIDVLVLFADRVIILQAKSKRLTLEARRGADGQIQSDFKKAIQDAYDQGLSCAKLIQLHGCKLIDAAGNELAIPQPLKEIFLLGVVSDHYPAMSLQVRHFLNYEENSVIHPPFVMDVFHLDAMAEMLSSPLHFLSYVRRRVKYSDKIMSSHELTILSYHLKRNLWFEEYDIAYLEDDIAADLDIAMSVRREGTPGRATPEGLLTRFENTPVGNLIHNIEHKPSSAVLDLGFLLLTLNEDALAVMNSGIRRIVAMAANDGKHHDLTLAAGGSGITIHCNSEPDYKATVHLANHCERRKYRSKAEVWHGVALTPREGSLRFGFKVDYPWKFNALLEERTPRSLVGSRPRTFVNGQLRKVGRNDPCPCTSGKKFKFCCGRS